MCGIAGVWRRQGVVHEHEVAAMLAGMQHRGPDDEGRFFDGDLGLGMRRLAVRDVAGGRQPYRSEDGQVIAVFNGEIYNYAELKQRVEAHGHRLRSDTDGEVLVHLYEMDGVDFVSQLRGMFAIALWDKSHQRLLLARDHLGQKPLYIFESGATLAFASELKVFYSLPGFMGEWDPEFLPAYLGHRFVPAPDTLVRGVKKLSPGEAMVVERHRAPKKWFFWQPKIVAPSRTASLEELSRELDSLLQETVATHLDADVPLGIFLSGGLDSSLLAALASRPMSRPITAWVAHFPARSSDYDESSWAKQVAQQFGLAVRTIDVESSFAPERLRQLAYVLDEPMADPTVLPLDALARAASLEETVMLSGEGADEIFAGYAGYGEPDSLRLLKRVPAPLRRWWMKRGWPGAGAFDRSFIPMAERYRGVGYTFAEGEQESLLRPEYRRSDRPRAVDAYWGEAEDLPELQAMQGFDVRWFLADDVLHKADRVGMHHHLEIRVPYCDYRVVEFALTLPLGFRRTAKEDKRILRQVAQAHLAQPVVSRPKQGFPTPLTDFMNGEASEWIRDLLTDARAETRAWLVPNQVSALLGQLGPGKGTIARQIYAVVMLELWAQEMKSRHAGALSAQSIHTLRAGGRHPKQSDLVPIGPT